MTHPNDQSEHDASAPSAVIPCEITDFEYLNDYAIRLEGLVKTLVAALDWLHKGAGSYSDAGQALRQAQEMGFIPHPQSQESGE